jgi:hypothetical protein
METWLMSYPQRDPYRPLAGRTTAVLILYGLRILLNLIAFGSSVLQYQLLAAMIAGVPVRSQAAEDNDARQGIITVVEIVFSLICLIALLMWVHRAAKNAWALESERLEYTPGWCVGCFFVPILNLFRPYQSMKMILQASTISSMRVKLRSVTPLVGFWWFLVITSGLLGRVIGATGSTSNTQQGLQSTTVLFMVASIMDIALSTVVILLVRATEQLQERKTQQAPESDRTCAGCGEPRGGLERVCPLCGREAPLPAPSAFPWEQ